ncbi:MAG: ABC transporter permease [Bacteroidales bacterium]|nr:ABC transporter permease [Bacteroidales bacterium]
MKKTYIKEWFTDLWLVLTHELKAIFTDGGFLIIFIVAGFGYPLLYNLIYKNGVLEDTPIAVVDNADCMESRRYIQKVDATRELKVAYHCTDMAEARELLEQRKVNGIMMFPADFGEKMVRKETAKLSIYADMSSFLYYKNLLMGSEFVMLSEMDKVKAIPYTENLPYNRTFSYSIFLISAILMLIIQQVMFYGMTLLAGTAREESRSFATLPAHLHGHGVGRVVFGRSLAYWLLFYGLGIYIATIVPAICGFPQRGNYWDILLLLMFFVTDCILFCQVWSTFINKRETVFVLLLFISPICLFLTGFSWPTTAFPAFWRVFSWLFPSTFGCQAFINLNTAGGDLQTISPQLTAMTIQCVCYFVLSCIALYVEQQVITRRSYSETIGQ